jgi:hypothetical protein
MNFREKGTTGIGILGSARLFGGPEYLEIPAVAPGAYIAEVGWPQNPGQYLGRTEIQVGTTPFEGEITVKKPAKLAVSVVLQASGGSTSPLGQINLSLRSDYPTGSLYATTGADGTFAMNVPDGEYQVQTPVRLPPDAYLMSIRQGNRDVLAEGLQIAGDTSMQVVIGSSGGTVEGIIKDSRERAVADAMVVLVPDGSQKSSSYFYRTGNSDQAGTFSIRGIAPGSYQLYSWAALDGSGYRNADFMKKYAGQGTAVKIAGGARLTVNTRVLDEERQ